MAEIDRESRIAELEAEVASLSRQLEAFRARTAEQMRGIADALPVMISYVDPDERFAFANRAYEPWFQRPIDQIVGKTLQQVLSPEEYAHRQPFVRRALSGETVRYEAWFDRPSGQRRAIIHHIPHLNQGHVIGFYALVQDITDHWHALEIARESEARFRRIADSAPIPMWVTAADRTRAFVNQAYVDFLGVPYAPALVFDWRTILHPDDQARVLAESVAGEASRKRFTLEARYRRADGEWRWLRSISQPRFDADGMPEGFIGVAQDITASKLAEAQAAAHLGDLQASVDRRTAERDRLWSLSIDAFVICDQDGRWLSASPAWERLLGRSPAELIGRTARWLEHPDDQLASDEARAILRQGESLPPFTNRLRGADGEYRWLTWSAVAAGDRAYCIARDVTEERRRADALRAAEEALRQAQKMEALGQLTGGVAHDFNNLLTPILGTLDLLLARAAAGSREQRLIDGAHLSAVRAKTLVQRLLAFARRQPLDRSAIDLVALVDGMGDLFRSTLGATITLSVTAEADLPRAVGDPNQLEMALLNLVVNARDAMPNGGAITIAIAREEIADGGSSPSAGRYLSLSVSDTGEGMDAETARRAAEPFFSTKASGAGTGLGLSMVHGLMGQLGGGMRIASEPGKGTRIELLLPATDAAPVATVAPAQARADRALTVLLVDDEPLVRANVAAMLAALGHHVTECGSGAEALALLGRGFDPDILVTDQVMPAMSGVDLAGAARAVQPGLPVLIVSGYPEGDERAVEAGRLAKPFGVDDLAAALSRLQGGA